MNNAYIVAAQRTAIGKFQGTLADIPAVDLGVTVIEAVLQKANFAKNEIDDIYFGNVYQGGLGQNIARQAALKAGLPIETTALTVNRVCASGLEAVVQGVKSILLNESRAVISGGTESMSRAPYILEGARSGLRMGDGIVVDSMIKDGLWCAINNYHMGITAENVAEKYHVTRQDQDEYALFSQQKAERAIKEGRFIEEIVPVNIEKKGTVTVFQQDEFPRAGVTLDSLAKLRPAFKKDGTVTAGNASGINDGAAAVILVGEERVKELSLRPMARIAGWASVGVDPSIMGIAPVYAIQKALKTCGLKIQEIGLFELNEAFAAQSVAVTRELKLDAALVNVNGGAIALGHPIGASGCRILVTLLHEMQKRKIRYGVAALCVGGGQGTAVVVENVHVDG